MVAEHAAGAAAPEALADQLQLRTALAAFPSGVTVVTVGGSHPHGMTANAFTSVSLYPPLVLVCIRRDARMHEALVGVDSFAISVLAAHQEGLARYFADRQRPPGAAQFRNVDWSPGHATDAPLIHGALAWLECTLWSTYDGGDHSIFLGRLVSAARRDGGQPLLFVGGRFCGLAQDIG